MKLFLDANILFSAAHNHHGKCADIIRLAKESFVTGVTCELAILQAERNLALKYSDSLENLEKQLSALQVVATIVTGSCSLQLPHDDLPIFLTARFFKCTHLITGDVKDFGKWMNKPAHSEGVIIQTASQYLKSIYES